MSSDFSFFLLSAASVISGIYLAHKLTNFSFSFSINSQGKALFFNSHETELLQDLIKVEDLRVTFSDIGGLEQPKNILQDEIRVFKYLQEIYSEELPPKINGLPVTVLVHGPPGTGKTMLAKATANELGVPLLRVQISTLQNKWFGETPKKVKAIFTLAIKLQPCVVLIDEIDALFSERNSMDHAANTHLKCEFMSQFDEFLTQNPFVFLIGVTNRPNALDDAVKRRLGMQIHVPLPSLEQRKEILQVICRDYKMDDNLNWDVLAKATNKYSASDLNQLLSQAHKAALCEEMKQNNSFSSKSKPTVKMIHISKGMDFVQPSTKQSDAFSFLLRQIDID